MKRRLTTFDSLGENPFRIEIQGGRDADKLQQVNAALSGFEAETNDCDLPSF